MKYVSDKAASQKGYLLDVPKGGSFADMVALKGDKNIGEGINKIISTLAEANGLQGVIDVADFNDPDKLGKAQDMVDRLSNLVAIFDTPALDFRSNRAEGDDLLGDAYEYLMRHFATESGKSKGQFYTPAEVSRIMAKVIGVVEFNGGHRYGDFIPGTDKVAEYGIAALIAGGLAAKAGLFKVLLGALVALKKVVVLGLVAAAAFLRKLFRRKPADAAAKP